MEKNQCNKCGANNLITSKYCCECGYELPKETTEYVVQDVPAKKTKHKYTKNQIVGLIVGIIVTACVSALVQKLFSTKPPTLDTALVAMANEMNKTLPMMLDTDTRMDNIMALPNKTVLYNYTLVNYEREMIDTVVFRSYLEPNIINSIKTNPDMKYFRENRVTMKYSYKDKDGNHTLTITVKPEQYR